MTSPFYRCPQCSRVSRKDDKVFEIAETAQSMGPFFAFALSGTDGIETCPGCSARHSVDDVYVNAKYDVPIEDVYGGRCGVDLTLIRSASEAGQIRLSEQEKQLLNQATRTENRSSDAKKGCLGLLVTGLAIVILAGGSALLV